MPVDPQKCWRLAERYLEEFFYPNPDLKAKFKRYQESAAGWSEFLYAYDEFYIVCDLMQWEYEELMKWVDDNCDRSFLVILTPHGIDTFEFWSVYFFIQLINSIAVIIYPVHEFFILPLHEVTDDIKLVVSIEEF